MAECPHLEDQRFDPIEYLCMLDKAIKTPTKDRASIYASSINFIQAACAFNHLKGTGITGKGFQFHQENQFELFLIACINEPPIQSNENYEIALIGRWIDESGLTPKGKNYLNGRTKWLKRLDPEATCELDFNCKNCIDNVLKNKK